MINLWLFALLGLLASGLAWAEEKIKVATTIGMVADLVKQVGAIGSKWIH